MSDQAMLMETETADLTTTERAELGRYEAVIKRGLDTFVSVGNALLAIRRDRLYRATHATFEAYCEQKWLLTANFAHKLIGAAEVVTNLQSVDNCTVLPANEAQARPLTKLPPEEQPAAWQEVLDTAPNGKPTAAHVERTVERLRKPSHAPTVEPTKPVYVEPEPKIAKPILDDREVAAKLRHICNSPAVEADVILTDLIEGRQGWYHDLVLSYIPPIVEADVLALAARQVAGERAAKAADQAMIDAEVARIQAQTPEPRTLPLPPLPDERLKQAALLRYMLDQARKAAREQYGDLTGKHGLLPAFERSVAELIEPLDSLIEILSGGKEAAIG